LRSIFARLFRYGGAVLLSALVLVPSAAASTTSGGRPWLHVGAQGFWVGVAQRDLTLVGYAVQDTGTYDSATKTQVDRFKKNHRVHQGGGIGPLAWHALVAQVRQEQSIRYRPAHLNSKGLAVAPRNAPAVVKRAIAAANRIAFRPYCYAGGHGSWSSPCYDCSGSTSYALHGGGLLWSPMAYMGGYGFPGLGKWMTIFANHTHVYMQLDGLWFDTADQQWGSYRRGDRWSTKRVDPASGYLARHPSRL
jgi:hypothetical protein